MSANESESDERLMVRLGTDPDAFEVFYRRHVGEMIAFAARRTASAEDVADLVATVFLAVIEWRTASTRGRAGPWPG